MAGRPIRHSGIALIEVLALSAIQEPAAATAGVSACYRIAWRSGTLRSVGVTATTVTSSRARAGRSASGLLTLRDSPAFVSVYE
jgi:hypothetical protein